MNTIKTLKTPRQPDRKSWLADTPTPVTLRVMSKKPQHEPPADDWAGLAQNLFGINLDKSGGDDDLLEEDMFKVEIPRPVEPPAPQVADEFVTFTEAAPPRAVEVPAIAPAPVTKPKLKASQKPVVVKRDDVDDPFGAGILDDVAVPTAEAECSDDGLTLPEDFDEEGLTLASDFDDGLTLPPDQVTAGLMLSADDDDGLTLSAEDAVSLEEAFDDEEDEEDEDDTDELPTVSSDAAPAAPSSERPRRRQPRRTREDAYWDMLENWEWEEIPADDSPRSDGDRPRRGDRDRGGRSRDRGDRGGRGGDRGGRGREDRPRSAGPAYSEERPRREEHRPAESAPSVPRSESVDSAPRPRREDRPREDRGPRTERRPDREARRDEPRQVAPSPSSAPPSGSEDFGFGIFEEQVPVRKSSVSTPPVRESRPPREAAVAQTTRAADAVLRDSNRAAGQAVTDDLVWPDDDSDVRSSPIEQVADTSGLPAADAAGESDRMVSASDVVPLDESEQRSRRPRRRRRRGPASETTTPPDGNEGTTFDLSEALSAAGESPDFIPLASADDSAVSTESAGDETADATDADRSSERTGGRRRRRRRRPGEAPQSEASSTTSADVQAEIETTEPAADFDDEEGEPEVVLKPIAYANVPSWEEAIRYLLEPHLVGRNLGPDDVDDGLASDPRGSGGAEPTSAPPPPRRRRGGGSGGRGRRP